MIIVFQKNRPYKKFVPRETAVLKAGDLQQVCIADDTAKPGEGGLQRLIVYPLAKVLALRHQAATLVGHPLVDLRAKDSGHGYIEVPRYQIDKIKRWQAAGDFIGVRNYNRKPGGKDNQVCRIRTGKLMQYGLLSEEDVLWLINVCDVSYHYVAEQKLALELEATADTPPASVAKHRRRRKDKLSRKARRRMDEEQALYGSTERIGRGVV